MLLWLGRAGLLLDLVGACFLWRGATPPVYRPRFGVIGPPGGVHDPDKEEQDWNRKAAKWDRLSKIGVVLLVMGFALQLIATWSSSNGPQTAPVINGFADHNSMAWKVLGGVGLVVLAWALGRWTRLYDARLDLLQKAGAIYFKAMQVIYEYPAVLFDLNHPNPNVVDPKGEEGRLQKAIDKASAIRVAIADAIALKYVMAAVFRRAARERWQVLIDALRAFPQNGDQGEWRSATHKVFEEFATEAVKECGYYWILKAADEWWAEFKLMLRGGDAGQQ